MSKAHSAYSQTEKLRLLVTTGLFAALIYVFTAYLHIPSGAGYTHAGDGLIYLAACILPTPYAACLLYTSDAADDLLCVDLGGRRIIKKKK